MSLGRANEKKGSDHHENRNVIFSGPAFNRHARRNCHCDGCGWSNLQAKASSGSNLQEELTPGSYCHLKFPAIREETLSSDHPVLLDPSDGDIIDYYGPCDEDPLGKDQVHEQKLDNYHNFQRDYED
jgi:hypothetical protein